MIAAIIAAAMSASSGEMNALATATSLDFYKRLVQSDRRRMRSYLKFSKLATAFWGLFACGVACTPRTSGRSSRS